MKKLIIIIAILFFAKVNADAQVADTAIYIQQILLSKSKYINKPFSVLENDLKIKIKKFNTHADITWDITKETSTSLWFIKPAKIEDYSEPRLLIYWQPSYLDHKQARNLFLNSNKGNWTPEADSFYRGGIIKDIGVLGHLVDNNGNLLH